MTDSGPVSKRVKLEAPPGNDGTAAAAAAEQGEAAAASSPGRRRRRPLSPAGKRASSTPPPTPAAGTHKEQQAAGSGSAAAQLAGVDAAAKVSAAAPQAAPAAAAPSAAAKGAAAAAANATRPAAQQQQQQQQQQPRQQPDQGGGGGGGKGRSKKGQQRVKSTLLPKFYQCVKRELPQAALHVYAKLQAEGTAASHLTPLVAGLLNVAVGNWQWEMHARHQHLQRSAGSGGTQQLQETFERYVAAERARLRQLQERSKQQQQQQTDDDAAAGDDGLDQQQLPSLSGMPASLQCHILRHQTDQSLLPENLHSTQGLEDVLADMPPDSLPLSSLLSKVASLVESDLAAAGAKPDETVLCQLARIAAITGDPDAALAHGMRCVELAQQLGGRSPARLRDFHPALVGYALTGQAGKAGEVVALMLEHCEPGDLTESEYALWLEAIANGGSYQQLQAALTQMAGDLNWLRPTTMALVQQFFTSDRAAAALAQGGPLASAGSSGSWQQQWVVPDASGRIAEAGVTLELQDLSTQDWAAFDAQLFEKSRAAEAKPGQFQTFRGWLDANGPFDLVIDGANIAFWGENYAGGGFRPRKIRTAYETIQALNPAARILLVLHERRYHESWDADAETGGWMDGLSAARRLYRTPQRMNDDLFWMYATIHAGQRGRLVSNDQMRDHVWSMLRPKHMLKWKERHVVRYTFNYPKTIFTPQEPTPYTPCVQQPRPGLWLLPCDGVGGAAGNGQQQGQQQAQQQRWLLCRPAAA